jgi:prepilin-type N-terminal cleavage/methylation domain-containing protein
MCRLSRAVRHERVRTSATDEQSHHVSNGAPRVAARAAGAGDEGLSLIEMIVALMIVAVVAVASAAVAISARRAVGVAGQRQVATALVNQALEVARTSTCPLPRTTTSIERGVSYTVSETVSASAVDPAETSKVFTVTGRARWTSAAASHRVLAVEATTVIFVRSPTC